MNDHMDISKTIEAKSDQINAVDLVKPETVTVTDVRKGDADQPVWVSTAEYPEKYFKPSKTVRRVLVYCWGPDASQYIGRQMTIYNDPSVTWAGEPVGGIRVSAVSHIEKSMTFPLAVSRGKRQRVTIEVIEQQPQTDWQALIQQAGNDQDALRDLWHQAQQQGAPQHVFDTIQQQAQGQQA